MIKTVFTRLYILFLLLVILTISTSCYNQANISINIVEKQKRRLTAELTINMKNNEALDINDIKIKYFIDNDFIEIKKNLAKDSVNVDYLNIDKIDVREISVTSKMTLEKDKALINFMKFTSDLDKNNKYNCPLILFDGNRIVFEYALIKPKENDYILNDKELSISNVVSNNTVKMSFDKKNIPKRAFMVYIVNAEQIRKKIEIIENSSGAYLSFSPAKIRDEIKDRFWIAIEWI